MYNKIGFYAGSVNKSVSLLHHSIVQTDVTRLRVHYVCPCFKCIITELHYQIYELN